MIDKIPDFLSNILLNEYGTELYNKIIHGYSKKRPVTFRVNTLKSNSDKIINVLNNNDIRYRKVEWYNDAFIIENADEKRIQSLDIYQNGEIYLQSLSSMLPVHVLSPSSNENILDMAAAPGGKTTQMAALSKNEALITACEKNKIRFDRLKYNINRQGANKVTLLLEDARKLDDFFMFDKILLDAPCSGSGTLNTNQDINKIFNIELVNRSVAVQQQLLKKALKILKKGNEMVYSTCSILKEENENNIQKLIDKNYVEIIPIDKKIYADIKFLPVKIDGTICICPNELYEGFFVAKLRKK